MKIIWRMPDADDSGWRWWLNAITQGAALVLALNGAVVLAQSSEGWFTFSVVILAALFVAGLRIEMNSNP